VNQSFISQDDYDLAMSLYRRAKSAGNLKEAKAQLEKAIAVCPVDEALPVLEGMRIEAIQLSGPARLLWRFWHGVTA
jgi:hypothetical protein